MAMRSGMASNGLQWQITEFHIGKLQFTSVLPLSHFSSSLRYALQYAYFFWFTEKYILHGDETYAVLNRLVSHNKKLFLITNSPFSFV